MGARATMSAVDLASGARAGVAALGRTLDAEQERWLLWLPVGIGAGVSVFFALPSEPPAWVAAAVPAVAVAMAALAWTGRAIAIALPLAAGAVALAGGFTAAVLATDRADGPRIETRLGARDVAATVLSVSRRPEGVRLLVRPTAIAGLDAAVLPDRVRISVRARLLPETPRPGDAIRLRASLRPIPAPAMPGAFDFQRHAWFERLGAIGHATVPLRLDPAAGRAGGLRVGVERVRDAVTERVRATIGGAAGAVAAALLTGERGAIPEAVNEAMRDSGLAHLLSISGLHMTMVAGLVYAALRALMALVPPLALRRPIKKWAALAAMVAAFGYLLLSGAAVPTQRAFLTALLVFAAVLIDRNPFSLRLVAVAAAVVLLLMPEALVGASFQMSFAAVIALIAAYEVLWPRVRAWRLGAGIVGRAALYLALSMATTVIATAATTPFAIHHFQRFAIYAVLANLVAVPLTSALVMPLAILALLAMPFGLEAWPLQAMGWAVDGVLAVAAWVAALPNAALTVPAMSVWGLATAALGGLWLCLWRTPWRTAGALPVVLGLGLGIGWTPAPDVLIDPEARTAAVRAEGGSYWMVGRRPGTVLRETWERRTGGTFAWSPRGDARARCGRSGCLRVSAAGPVVGIVRTEAGFRWICRRADLVVALVPPEGACGARRTVVAPDDIARLGAMALTVGEGGYEAHTVVAAQGRRRWSNRTPEAADDSDGDGLPAGLSSGG